MDREQRKLDGEAHTQDSATAAILTLLLLAGGRVYSNCPCVSVRVLTGNTWHTLGGFISKDRFTKVGVQESRQGKW